MSEWLTQNVLMFLISSQWNSRRRLLARLHLFPIAEDVEGRAVSEEECAVNRKHNRSLCVNIVIYVFMILHMRDCAHVHIFTAGMRTEFNHLSSCGLSSLAFVHPHGKKTPRTLRHMQLFTLSFSSYSPPPSSLSSGLSSGTKTNPSLHSLKSFHSQY